MDKMYEKSFSSYGRYIGRSILGGWMKAEGSTLTVVKVFGESSTSSVIIFKK